ncbi:hypothetical protein B0H34DRAFT_45699 [Crassisporium funariophilum]|nr:hypothetical protein B0H34DRAFT_45699 [Crassisporium funariophilum]
MLTATHISIPLGIIIGLLASFVQSLGLTIQRKSHVLNQALPEHRQRAEHRRPLWLLGFTIFFSSNIIGSFVQIASLPVVILAPLGAVSLLWNAFFARLLLGDVFSLWMILGTILIAGGAILIAFFGIVPEPTRSLEDLLVLFRRPAFVVYFSILGFVVFVCLAITHLTEFSLSRRISKSFPSDPSSDNLTASSSNIDLPIHSTNLTTGLTEEINGSLTTERTPLLSDRKAGNVSPLSDSPLNDKRASNTTLRSINRTRLLLAISYASFSGIISGMCLLFAKSGVELLILTLSGDPQFWRWEAWVLVLGLIIFALLQLWYLHKALILADPTLVCPSAFCFYNLSSIINGLVYFDQFSLISPLHLSLVGLGIVVLLGGVWVVSIQSGGGGVDVGPWNEEDGEFTDEEGILYSEPEDIEDGDQGAETVAMAKQSITTKTVRPRIGPVPMERETRSESHLQNIPVTPTTAGLGLDLGPPAPEFAQDVFGQSSTVSSDPHRLRAGSQLYGATRSPSHRSKHSARRKPSADPRQSTSTQPGHPRTVSYSNSQYSHANFSPPLGPVSTLGAGFQIGLSPVSPGFTIMPLDRRRRTSGIGIGGPSFADVANSVVAGTRIIDRRRTVSEGEITRRTRDDHHSENSSDEEAEIAGEISGDAQPPSSDQEDAPSRTSGRRRWRWLRKVFIRKD